jgi:4-hydroxy-tetrahydrodipicolinate synthase
MITPFDASGRLDEARLRGFVDWQIEQGVQGLIPLGSTGEFLSMTREERARTASIVIEQAAGRVPVLVGTAAEWTDEAVSLSKEAESLGADGVMVVPPYYSSPTEDEIFEHYRRIGEALTIPVMVYNNPYTSNVDLQAPLVARLSEVDNISYIKESSGSVPRTTEILRLCGDRMTVFAGYHPWETYLVGA